MVTYGAWGKQIYKKGYTPIPIVANNKYPAVREWQNLVEPLSFNDYYNCGIGLLCGMARNPVYAIDVDIVDEAIVGYLHEVISSIGPAPYRIGKAPKRLYLFRAEQDGISKLSSRVYDLGIDSKLEILGRGQQFVAFGTHPDTKRPYAWPGKSPMSLLYKELPIITGDQMRTLIAEFDEYAEMLGLKIKERPLQIKDPNHVYEADNPLFEKQPLGIAKEQLKEMLSAFDPDCARETWLKVGFALHHESSGELEGFEMWDEWSSKGSKYKTGETDYFWGKFGGNNKEPVTAAYLLTLYKEKTGNKVSVTTAEEVEQEVEEKDAFSSLDWSLSRFSDNPPPIEMIIEGMLPKGVIGLLFSAGGVGKSTVCLYMALRIALAKEYDTVDFFGRAVNGGSVVILTAEDPDEVLNIRLVALYRVLAEEFNVDYDIIKQMVTEKLFILSTFGIPVQLFSLKADKGILKRTSYYNSFVKRLQTISDLQLVVIDTKTRYSPGEGEGNVIASNEITYYEMISRATGRASVLLLHHTSKKSRDGSQDGQQAYRDASALFDNTRLSWYIRPLTAKEVEAEGISLDDATKHFIFENSKNNYIPRHVDIVVKREGYEFTYKNSTLKTVSPEDVKDKKRQDAIDTVVAYLQTLKSGSILQADLLRVMREEKNMGRTKVIKALAEACDDGLVEKTDPGIGKSKLYCLTEVGKNYKLIIES